MKKTGKVGIDGYAGRLVYVRARTWKEKLFFCIGSAAGMARAGQAEIHPGRRGTASVIPMRASLGVKTDALFLWSQCAMGDALLRQLHLGAVQG